MSLASPYGRGAPEGGGEGIVIFFKKITSPQAITTHFPENQKNSSIFLVALSVTPYGVPALPKGEPSFYHPHLPERHIGRSLRGVRKIVHKSVNNNLSVQSFRYHSILLHNLCQRKNNYLTVTTTRSVPGGVLRGGRFCTGAEGERNRPSRKGTTSAPPLSRLLWLLSCQNKKVTPPAEI